MDRAELGEWLFKVRKARGFTVRELAALLKMDHSKVSRVENGKQGITFKDICRWVEECGGRILKRPGLLCLSRAVEGDTLPGGLLDLDRLNEEKAADVLLFLQVYPTLPPAIQGWIMREIRWHHERIRSEKGGEGEI